MRLSLRLRTPSGLLLDEPVQRVIAEDLDGWFGIAPGRADLVAALQPGLLLFRDDDGEGFVALAGGLLDLRDGECRVLARQALFTRALEQIADEVDALMRARDERQKSRASAMNDLVREALRRLAQEVR